MPTLAAKLAYLLRRRRRPDGELPSNRDLSGAIQQLPGYTRGGSVGQLSKLRRGEDENPSINTVHQLASVLDAPAAFLLPGWDDYIALDVLNRDSTARDIVRHLRDLPPNEVAHLLTYLQERREQLGLERHVSTDTVDETPDSGDVNRRHRRRRTMREAAEYAADSLEGV
ncbi:hypothetical protein [Streptomyces sp. WZ-12]|uniref:hypothetical protein n=1 Tax=Streptomyces sp. WZ-12 TaxID=3030210 RepID=UPI002381879D|nr:hypothetical protein [Streptomyces sp. WZ-12]